jgi:hypothetical protein
MIGIIKKTDWTSEKDRYILKDGRTEKDLYNLKDGRLLIRNGII